MNNVTVLSDNPDFEGLLELKGDICFASPDGLEQKLMLIKPQGQPRGKGWPLVMFIQGSAWTKPDQYWEIPQLSLLASMGFVVATVTHRSAFEAPAPAFLLDVKTALRYLRAHAGEYGIDRDKVCVWGTSSGGNAALLMGLTGDDPAFESGDWVGQSTGVQAVVDCFGPTDLVRMAEIQYRGMPLQPDNIFVALGGKTSLCSSVSYDEMVELIRDKLALISPVSYLKPGLELPPFLILHGDADPVVRFEDSEAFFSSLCSMGYEADLVRVTGAGHEGSFWSAALLERIFAFIREKLG